MKYKLEIRDKHGDIKNIDDYLNVYDELIFDNYKDAILESLKFQMNYLKLEKV